MSRTEALITAARREARALARVPRWALIVTILWALEVFVVQELTLVPMHWQSLRSVITYRTVRFLIDLTACGCLVAFLPRWGLIAVFALNPLFYVGVLVYEAYFHQPLSALVLTQQGAEGVRVSDAFLPLVRSWHAVFLIGFFVKSGIVWFGARNRPVLQHRGRPAGTLAGAHLFIVLLMNLTLQGFWKIGGWDSVSGIGSIYGYLWTWGAELVFVDAGAIRDRAIERARVGPPGGAEHLTRIERPFPLRERLVFLQVESLDEAVMNFRIDGKEVTPNLAALSKRAMRYVVQAPKGTGSSDADFRALMGREPSSELPTYKILDYPYAGSFIEELGSHGYRTMAVHGVTGEFFNRRHAYEKMGFDEILFREELVDEGLAEADGWAVRDAEVLRVAAERLGDSPTPVFSIVITATSHIPFPVPERYRVFFPEETAAGYAYFDSMHRLDAVIGAWVRSLPKETTLVLYGDHTSQMENPELGYRQLSKQNVGCVPFLVIDLDEDLSALQTSGQRAVSCELTMSDALRFVHDTVRRGGPRAKAK